MLMNGAGYPLYDLLAFLLVIFFGFHHHNRLLKLLFVRHRKSCHAAQLDAANLLRQHFQIVRPDVTTFNNNHILAARGDKQVITDAIADVTSVQPSIWRDNLVTGSLVVEITAHYTRALQKNLAALAIAQRHTTIVPYRKRKSR